MKIDEEGVSGGGSEEGSFVTTLGELVEALTRVAEEAGESKERCYKLASIALAEILRKNKKTVNFSQ